MDTDEAIKGRRSIRRFRPDRVPDKVVLELLQLTQYAPSSMNGQPWVFVAIDDKSLLREIASIKDNFCPPEKKQFKATMFESAPLAIAVCVDQRQSFGRGLENGVIATTQLMLAASSRGLSSVYLSAYRSDQPELLSALKVLLNLPAHIDPITVLPLGYPAETPASKELKPLNVFRNTYEA